MNKKFEPFDREVKIILLNALKRGCFEQPDIDILEKKWCFGKVIDPFRQMRINNGLPVD